MAGLALCVALKLVQRWVIELCCLATRIKATGCGTASGGQNQALVGRTAGGVFYRRESISLSSTTSVNYAGMPAKNGVNYHFNRNPISVVTKYNSFT